MKKCYTNSMSGNSALNAVSKVPKIETATERNPRLENRSTPHFFRGETVHVNKKSLK